MKNTKKYILIPLCIIIMIILIMILLTDLLPLIKEVYLNRKDELKTVDYVTTYGTKGIPILCLLQILDVFSIIIPAAPIQFFTGLCYGLWKGFLICITGFVIGNILVFIIYQLFKKISKRSLSMHPLSKFTKNKWINFERIKTMKHPEKIAFLLYFVPGVPNEILPYLFAQTSISLKHFSLCVLFAGAPSMFMCIWIGKALADRNSKVVITMSLLQL